MHHNSSKHQFHNNTPWIIYPGSNQSSCCSAGLRLFCFPFAGGGASVFRSWRSELPTNVELACIQLPGRENRRGEPLLHHLADVIQHLKLAIIPHLTVPFIFFGHSMGALIAFELVRSLRQTQHPLPQHLFVSACHAPQLPRHKPPRHTLSDAELFTELRRLEGTPAAILDNDELMESCYCLY